MAYYCKIVAVTIMLVIALQAEFSPVAGDCGTTPAPNDGACSGYYTTCVINVITGLRDATPNTKKYSFAQSYPKDGDSGGVKGTATCVHEYGLTACQDCLVDAFNYLNACPTSAAGSYGSDGCTMEFSQI